MKEQYAEQQGSKQQQQAQQQAKPLAREANTPKLRCIKLHRKK
jgi:hypothetical protein